MPTSTYIALGNYTVPVTAASVTFANIPATYRDLIVNIVVQGLTTTPTTRDSYFTLNGSGGTSLFMYAAGSGVSGTDSEMKMPYGPYQNTSILQVMDYSATDKHKVILQRTGAPSNVDWVIASRWANTAAVTSITFNAPDSGVRTFTAGSTFALYGIAS